MVSGPIWASTQSVTCGCKGDFAWETWEWFTRQWSVLQYINCRTGSKTWSDHLNHICSQNVWSDIVATVKHLLTCQSTTALTWVLNCVKRRSETRPLKSNQETHLRCITNSCKHWCSSPDHLWSNHPGWMLTKWKQGLCFSLVEWIARGLLCVIYYICFYSSQCHIRVTVHSGSAPAVNSR